MSDRPRVLWLHTQPEHYFNCMMDDLARTGSAEYIAAFSFKGEGLYKETPIPAIARSVFLRPRPGKTGKPVPFFGKYHADWRADLLPLKYDMVIVSGYASRTHREVIRDAHQRNIPIAMWSDSNLRSQRGKGLKLRLRRALKKRYLAKIIRQTDHLLTANSRGIAYWRYYGAPREKILLCPCYADYPRIEAARALARGDVLAKFGLPPEARVLFTAARLVDAKGLDLSIAAFLAAGLQRQGWHYLLAGTGPLDARLRSLAGAECGRSIHFPGFQQPRENLSLMVHADLFLLPSRYEPHGIVIAESMAAGTPVLASDVCGAALDLVRSGVSGELFRSGDPGDLRRRLVDLASDAAKLAAMRAGARSQFEVWFAATSPIKVVRQLVARIAAARGPE